MSHPATEQTPRGLGGRVAELERWNADLAEKIRRMERQVEAGHKLLATLADRPVYRMGGES